MSWSCPECGSDKLAVNIETSANLIQDGELFETEVEGDHEWDNGSTMWCKVCNHIGCGIQFQDIAGLDRTGPEGPMPTVSTPLPRRRYNDGE